jgi:hypothetical protein
MAGTPLTTARVAHLKNLGPDGEEQILVWIASGMSIRQVAVELGLGPNGARALYRWRDEDEQRKTAWAKALEHRADFLAEESLEIADDAIPEAAAIRKAELQVKARQWLASVSNPERYGKERKGAQVHIEHLHLTAVKEFNAARQVAAKERLALRRGDVVPDADYEIVDDEPAMDDLL